MTDWKNKKSIMNKKEALECIRNVEADRVPKEFYKDKSFILEAVEITGLALSFVINIYIYI
jgi:hypothetical protein